MTTMRRIVARVEPIGEQICRDTGRVSNCDFKVQVDTSTPDVVNAYQTLRKMGVRWWFFRLACEGCAKYG